MKKFLSYQPFLALYWITVSLLAGAIVPQVAQAVPVLVTNTNDSGPGSLRTAIVTANSNSGSTIQFAIPPTDPGYNGSVYTINVINQLPGLLAPTTIDGTSQPGYPIISPYTPIINLANAGPAASEGLVIQAGADGSRIQGLAIYGFTDAIHLNNGVNNVVIRANYLGVATNGSTIGNTGNGIYLAGNTGTTIGGTNPPDGNLIARNGNYGIYLNGFNNTMQGNLIGTDAMGMVALPNQDGGIIVNTSSTGNLIGGTVAGARNIISGNGAYGLVLSSATNNTAQGNYIGTNSSGTAAVPNQFGIGVFGTGNVIGGTAAGAGNVISGNTTYGLYIADATTTAQGNYIGTDATGTSSISNGSAPGHAAVYINAANNTIGGTAAGAGNLISGNHTDAIVVSGGSNTIQGNFIGTNAGGATTLGNSGAGGLLTNGAQNNTVGGINSGEANTIAFNAAGVNVTDGGSQVGSTIGNAIRGNSIYSNIGLGINLVGGTEDSNGVTANDVMDSDNGPNHLQNFPIINGVGIIASSVTITGTLNSTLAGTFNIDVYRNTAAGVGGYGQGQVYVGSSTVTTDSGGNGSFTLEAANPGSNQFYTATATDANGNTSEFSLAASASSYIVTNTSDTGTGSLHDAIVFANTYPGTTIHFNIPGAGPHTISATAANALPAITTANTTIDGYSQPGASQNSLANGDNANLNIVIDGAGQASGLVINNVPNCVLQGLVINHSAANAGVIIQGANATNNTVQGCFIGTDSTGAVAAPNTINGITIMGGAYLNTIGGDVGATPGARNVISGNSSVGIVIQDPNSSTNLIEGNYIGTTATGLTALPNGLNGIDIKNAAQSNTVGGTTVGTRNVISGNAGNGVSISGDSTNANVVQGNYIGTERTGAAAVANGTGGMAGLENGVIISGGAQNNIIGGTTAGARNIISGNFNVGVYLTGGPTAGNLVQGNYIGTGAAGTSALGNDGDGVDIVGNANNNAIGGTGPGARNIIADNNFAGIYIAAAADSNTVQGNYIGTDVTGTAAIGNADGIHLTQGATSNVIGGTAPGAGNVISGNVYNGVHLDSNSYFNVVEGNAIGTDASNTLNIPNNFGVTLSNGASSNIIGSVVAGGGNTIAFNTADGVLVTGSTSTDNALRGNSLFSNGGLGINLQLGGEANRTVTPNDVGDADTGPNNLQNYPVLTSALATNNTAIVKGTLNSLPNNAYFIDLYSSPSTDASGHGEGQNYLGTQSVTTDASGNASFSASVTAGAGQIISATATTNNASEMSNMSGTSEFAQNISVVPTIASNNVSLLEGDSGTTNAVFTVTLSAPSTQPITVQYATADGTATAPADYQSISGTLNFSPGTTTQTIKVPVNGDTLNELDETFFVNLSVPTNAQIAVAQGTGTILNDDALPRLSINDVSALEGNTGTSKAVFTVTIPASGQTVSVDYATANGTATAPTDYTSVSGTLTFAPGVTTQTITVPITGDTIVEGNQTFSVNLANPVNATIAKAQGMGTITDDDVLPTLSINDVSQPEGDAGTTNAIFTVTLSAPSSQTVTVSYATADGTATGGADYKVTTNTLTFAPGVTTQTISVSVVGDTLNEANETFFVRLFGALNATMLQPKGTVTIVDDDPVPSLAVGDASVNVTAGSAATEVFTVTLSAPSGQLVTVAYTTADGTATQPANYSATSGTLSFAPGETSKQITVTANGVAAQPLRTFTVDLSNAVNATLAQSAGTGTVVTDATPTPTPTPVPIAIVTTTQDSGFHSLRAAINLANANPGTTIKFNIPATDAGFRGGVFTLRPRAALPAIKANGITIDGDSQPVFGAGNAGAPRIVLNGALAGINVPGLEVAAANCLIKGLTLNGFDGGGVRLAGATAQHNIVQGCYIGTDAGGTSDVANGTAGIAIQNGAQHNTIGGTTAGARNVISGNAGDGVLIDSATYNNVLGNYIGTDAGGANMVPNLLHGVEVVHGANNNIIGSGAAGSINKASSNIIAFNRNDGVHVAQSSVGNSIRGNAITSNTALGINLVGTGDLSTGVTLNDALDKDTGPNHLQNFPVITDTGPGTSGGTELDGTLNSTPNSTFILDFYNNTAASAAGYGQGQQYLSSQKVGTNSSGNASFTFTFPGTGQFFAATATNVVTGDTSEFSQVPLNISSFSPASGPVNTLVTINGNGFDDATAVYFTDVNADDGTLEATDVTTLSSGQILARVPTGATTGPITVENDHSSATTVTDFVVTQGPATPPPNDNFANAQKLSDDAGTVTGTNVNATKEPNEPTHADNGGSSSIWYKWTASNTGSASFATFGSNFDTVLAVYTGSRINDLTPVVSNDDAGLGSQSAVRFQAVKGQTYYIAVDGADYGGITAQGAITLNYALTVSRPPNDKIAAAQAIRGDAGQVKGTNENATVEPGEPAHAGRPSRKSVWYAWLAPATGSVTFTTAGSDFDTRLAVYTSKTEKPSVGALNALASNDDEDIVLTSSVTFSATAGRTYYIAVDGFDYGDGLNGDSGHIVLSWTLSAANGTPVKWINPAGGNWHSPANWSPHRVPGPTDIATITLPGKYTVTLDVDGTVGGLALGGISGTQTLVLQGHALALNGVSSVNGHGVLKLSEGVLTVQSILNLLGTCEWTGGHLNGQGALTIASSGQLKIADAPGSAAPKYLGLKTVNNFGATHWSGTGSILAGNGTKFKNNGLFYADGDATFGFDKTGATNPTFINLPGDNHTTPGQFIKTVGRGTADAVTTPATAFDQVVLFNSGADADNLSGYVAVKQGTLRLGGGGDSYGRFYVPAGAQLQFTSDYYFAKDVASISGIGHICVQGNMVNVDTDVNAQSFSVCNGTLAGNSNLTATKEFNWEGGGMSGHGSTNINTGANLDIHGTKGKSLLGRTLDNAGDANWTGTSSITAGEGAVINNSGTFNTQGGTSGSTLAQGAGDPATFNNSGTLNPGDAKQPGASNSRVGPRSFAVSAPGLFNIFGNYSQSVQGVLNMDVSGTTPGNSYDQVKVSGTAQLNGNLNLQFGYMPKIGDKFTVLTYAQHTGSFSTINAPNLPPGTTLQTTYTATGLVVQVLPKEAGTFTITGRVVNRAGDGVPGVTITRSGTQSARSPVGEVTDANGYYTLQNVAPGTYTLTPSLSGATFDPATQSVTVGAANVTAPNFTVLLNITGRIVNSAGNGLANVTVALRGSPAGPNEQTAQTDTNGYYALNDVAPGAAYIVPTRAGYAFNSQNLRFPISIGSEGISEANFTGFLTPCIIGQVRSGKDISTGLAGATVKLVDGSGQVAVATTAANGYYFFEAVPPGNYAVGPSLQGWLFNVATANVTDTNNYFVLNFAGTRLSAATGGMARSKVTLSTATARSAGQSVMLQFGGRLNSETVGDAARYQVKVNGRVVAVESVAYRAATSSVVLGLPEGSLHIGDKVNVAWTDLPDAKGALLTEQVGPLVVGN